MPPDFSVGFGSEVEEQAKSFEQLRLVLILAVLLVYAVMASQYESLRDPFIIMFSIPVAAIGVVLTLMWTNTPFSMQAYIGIIMLAGIVVSNAILLVDYINTLRRRDNLPLREAVELGGRTRLRPILMTSIATMLGLVPMALGLGDGGELQAPLARVVIGGLLASTLVTLVLVPAVYTRVRRGPGRPAPRHGQALDGLRLPAPGSSGDSSSDELPQQLLDSTSADGVAPVGGDLRQRLQHEAALPEPRVRHGEPWLVDDRVSVENQVEIQRARRVLERAGPAGVALDVQERRRAAPAPSRSVCPTSAAFRKRGCGPAAPPT